jgi:hypothetical protein
MNSQCLTMEEYRLQCVEQWPDSPHKQAALTAIQRRLGASFGPARLLNPSIERNSFVRQNTILIQPTQRFGSDKTTMTANNRTVRVCPIALGFLADDGARGCWACSATPTGPKRILSDHCMTQKASQR